MPRRKLPFRKLLAPACGLLVLWPHPLRGADPASAPIVALPPVMVEAASSSLHWRYAKSGRIEILSLCNDGMTTAFIRQLEFFDQQLDAILPRQFRFTTSLPTIHLICDDTMRERLDRDIPAEMYLDPSAPHAGPAAPAMRTEVLPRLFLQDIDSAAIFAILNSRFQDAHQLSYLPSYMESLLRRRTPRLPAWFIDGFMSLYGRMSLVTVATTPDPTNFITSAPVDRDRDPVDLDPTTIRLRIPPFLWISDEENRKWLHQARQRMASHSTLGPLLLPLPDLLVAPHPPRDPGAALDHYRRAWVAEASLLVRWQLNEVAQGRGKPFWKFLDEASDEPATEARFHESFGLSYQEMLETLARYAIKASSRECLVGASVPNPPPVYPRAASPEEIARLKGDWERLEAAFVKQSYPALGETYLEHAHQTLWQAYGSGDRDPGLLAAMGLYECDVGDDRAALPFLSAAAQSGPSRPRAYFEQARILYHEALAKPEGAAGKLSAGQSATILGCLAAQRKLAPPLVSGSELFANLWFHSDLAPSPQDLAELEAQALLFPKDSGLTLEVAAIKGSAGEIAGAHRLIALGLANVDGDAMKSRFLQLSAMLEGKK